MDRWSRVPSVLLGAALLAGMAHAAALPAPALVVVAPYALHGAIRIDGDASLPGDPALTGVVGGAGTAEDPYRIEGWDIVPAGGAAILIANTSAHVLVRGNYLHDGERAPDGACVHTATEPWCPTLPPLPEAGLEIVNARNVRVEGNLLTGNDIGVAIHGGSDIVLAGNRVTRDRGPGTASDVLGASERFLWGLDDPLLQAGFHVPPPVAHHGVVGVLAFDVVNLTLEGNDLGPFDVPNQWAAVDAALVLRRADVRLLGNHVHDTFYGLVGEDLALHLGHETWERLWGGYVVRYSAATIQESVFMEAGLSLDDCPSASVRDSVFRSARIGFYDSHADVRASLFVNASVSSSGEGHLRVEGNRFLGDGSPYRPAIAFGGSGLAAGNVIEDYGIGLWFPSTSDAAARDNVVVGSRAGAWLRSSGGLLEGNRFEGNEVGVVAFGPLEDRPVLRGNALAGNGVALANLAVAHWWPGDPLDPPSATALHASENWWGSAAGPVREGPNRVVGAALVEPWRTTPPP